MRARLRATPREFHAASVPIKDFGAVELAPGDMISVATASGRECDITATPWGLYLAPSINGRLKAQGFRVALVKNSQGKVFINAVEEDRLDVFELYLAKQGSHLLQWLSGDSEQDGE